MVAEFLATLAVAAQVGIALSIDWRRPQVQRQHGDLVLVEQDLVAPALPAQAVRVAVGAGGPRAGRLDQGAARVAAPGGRLVELAAQARPVPAVVAHDDPAAPGEGPVDGRPVAVQEGRLVHEDPEAYAVATGLWPCPCDGIGTCGGGP